MLATFVFYNDCTQKLTSFSSLNINRIKQGEQDSIASQFINFLNVINPEKSKPFIWVLSDPFLYAIFYLKSSTVIPAIQNLRNQF